MTKNSHDTYKLFYFFLAVMPQLMATLFSFSIVLNMMAIFQSSADRNQVYLLALVGALIWGILLVVLHLTGVFSSKGISLNNFKADVLRILGYSFLAGGIIGLLAGLL